MPKLKKGDLELVNEIKGDYKVTPLFSVNGMDGKPAPHVLEGMELPEYKAVSLIKVGGTTNWAPVLLTIKDGRVTEMVAGEPNMWQVAVDLAKIDFVKTFMRPETI